MTANESAQAQAREMMPRRSWGAANLPRHRNLKAQRLLPAALWLDHMVMFQLSLCFGLSVLMR